MTSPPLSNPWTLALLTDYGLQDGYAGTLKGALLSLLTPPARQLTTLVDVTHAIPPHRIDIGAWQLAQAVPYFPPHTVFMAIVDPNVGSPEQGHLVAIRPDYQQVFIAPDNGLLAPIIEQYQCSVWALTSPQSIRWQPASLLHHPTNPTAPSRGGLTFAGRDLYAPLAATLLNGLVQGQGNATLNQLAHPVTHWSKLNTPTPIQHPDGSLTAHVLFTDHFGNAITNLPAHWIDRTVAPSGVWQLVWQGDSYPVTIQPTYHAIATSPHSIALVPGSHGAFELACYGQPLSLHLPFSASETASATTPFQLLPSSAPL